MNYCWACWYAVMLSQCLIARYTGARTNEYDMSTCVLSVPLWPHFNESSYSSNVERGGGEVREREIWIVFITRRYQTS